MIKSHPLFCFARLLTTNWHQRVYSELVPCIWKNDVGAVPYGVQKSSCRLILTYLNPWTKVEITCLDEPYDKFPGVYLGIYFSGLRSRPVLKKCAPYLIPCAWSPSWICLALMLPWACAGLHFTSQDMHNIFVQVPVPLARPRCRCYSRKTEFQKLYNRAIHEAVATNTSRSTHDDSLLCQKHESVLREQWNYFSTPYSRAHGMRNALSICIPHRASQRLIGVGVGVGRSRFACRTRRMTNETTTWWHGTNDELNDDTPPPPRLRRFH